MAILLGVQGEQGEGENEIAIVIGLGREFVDIKFVVESLQYVALHI